MVTIDSKHPATYRLALLLAMLAGAVLARPVMAQEPEEAPPASAQPEVAEAAEMTEVTEVSEEPADGADEVIDDVEDSDLDEQTYEEDDDDFIPTEEIPADEPIPFPSNI